MTRIDTIIDALERKEGFYNKYKLENALEAARELRELKPVGLRWNCFGWSIANYDEEYFNRLAMSPENKPQKLYALEDTK